MNFWVHLGRDGKQLNKQPNHYPEPVVYYEASQGEQVIYKGDIKLDSPEGGNPSRVNHRPCKDARNPESLTKDPTATTPEHGIGKLDRKASLKLLGSFERFLKKKEAK